jgi:hypothetical protein
MKSPIQYEPGIGYTWDNLPGDRYLVTGIDRAGKRFRIDTASFQHANGINVWHGTKWLLRDGKRWKLWDVYN